MTLAQVIEKEKAKEIALRMLDEDVDLDFIARMTGLSPQEIKGL